MAEATPVGGNESGGLNALMVAVTMVRPMAEPRCQPVIAAAAKVLRRRSGLEPFRRWLAPWGSVAGRRGGYRERWPYGGGLTHVSCAESAGARAAILESHCP